MKLMKILLAAGAVIILAVLVLFAGMAVLVTDVMSYTATGSETLNQAGVPAGKALVVYDPGMTGTAKNAGAAIADNLREQGYTVELAGVRSQAAMNVSGYDVIVVGGPTYMGNLSSAAGAYLDGLSQKTDATIGVFTTGGVAPESDDPAYLQQFVAGVPEDSPLKIRAAVKVLQGDDVEEKSDAFVDDLVG